MAQGVKLDMGTYQPAATLDMSTYQAAGPENFAQEHNIPAPPPISMPEAGPISRGLTAFGAAAGDLFQAGSSMRGGGVPGEAFTPAVGSKAEQLAKSGNWQGAVQEAAREKIAAEPSIGSAAKGAVLGPTSLITSPIKRALSGDIAGGLGEAAANYPATFLNPESREVAGRAPDAASAGVRAVGRGMKEHPYIAGHAVGIGAAEAAGLPWWLGSAAAVPIGLGLKKIGARLGEFRKPPLDINDPFREVTEQPPDVFRDVSENTAQPVGAQIARPSEIPAPVRIGPGAIPPEDVAVNPRVLAGNKGVRTTPIGLLPEHVEEAPKPTIAAPAEGPILNGPRTLSGESALRQILTGQDNKALLQIAKSRGINVAKEAQLKPGVADSQIIGKIIDSFSPEELEEVGAKYLENTRMGRGHLGDIGAEAYKTKSLQTYFPELKISQARLARTAKAVENARAAKPTIAPPTPPAEDVVYHGASPSSADLIRKSGRITAGDYTSDLERAKSYGGNEWNPNAPKGSVFVVKRSDLPQGGFRAPGGVPFSREIRLEPEERPTIAPPTEAPKVAAVEAEKPTIASPAEAKPAGPPPVVPKAPPAEVPRPAVTPAAGMPKFSEAQLQAMRSIRGESDRLLEDARRMTPRHGEVAAGSEHVRSAAVGESLATFLRELGRGKTPEEALAAAKEEGRLWARKWNSKLAKTDMGYQMALADVPNEAKLDAVYLQYKRAEQAAPAEDLTPQLQKSLEQVRAKRSAPPVEAVKAEKAVPSTANKEALDTIRQMTPYEAKGWRADTYRATQEELLNNPKVAGEVYKLAKATGAEPKLMNYEGLLSEIRRNGTAEAALQARIDGMRQALEHEREFTGRYKPTKRNEGVIKIGQGRIASYEAEIEKTKQQLAELKASRKKP